MPKDLVSVKVTKKDRKNDKPMEYAEPEYPYGMRLTFDTEIAGRFPALKIVIGAMGVPFLDQTICMLSKHENVYADLSISPQKKWEVYNIVVSAHEADVMDKLLFGSGYPIAKPDNCIETLLGFNMMLGDTNLPGVPREEIRGIIERDTLALLGITLP